MYDKIMTQLKSIPYPFSIDGIIKYMISSLREYTKAKTIDVFFAKKGEMLICWYPQTEGKLLRESYFYAKKSFERNAFYNGEHVFAYPLIARSDIFGVIVCFLKNDRVEDLARLSLLIDYFALLLNSEKLSIIANKDKLTQLNNRGAIFQKLESWEENEQSYGVILMDIDHFKHYNDSYGHPIGDYILKKLAQTLKRSARNALIGRYGGEEFLIGIENTNPKALMKMMERVRTAVKNTDFSTEEYSLRVTMSLGGAVTTSIDERDVQRMIQAADDALYYSKRNGRNRSTLYDDLPKDTSE